VTAGSKPLNYEQARDLARSDDPGVRRELAERRDLPAELLYFLAEDSHPEVRRAVARNDAAPRQTHDLFVKDADESVRADLAHKICKLAPGLDTDNLTKVQESARQALEMLAKDQMVIVRQVLSDALKDVVDAPADIIRTLAADQAIEVSGPVLENSPVLTDADLLSIIDAQPPNGALSAISRRAQVSETVSDAVIGADDVEAIGALLGNQNAQIREEALDDLIDRAGDNQLWHQPLVARPQLPPGAAARMASFLADNLLEALSERGDLDAESIKTVKATLDQRFRDQPSDIGDAPAAAQDFLDIEPPIDMVKNLLNRNRLDRTVIIRALQSADHAFVYASLIVRSQLDEAVVRNIFKECDAKAIAALCWRSSLPMDLAVTIQQRMGRIAPSELVQPSEAGDYPLDEGEMTWLLDFHVGMVKA
jgi:uncharacterized protein (DUF2336 family)